MLDYKHTELGDGGVVIDAIRKYDENNEVSKELLYCSGKYLVFKINFRGSGRNSIVALFDTSDDSWVKSSSSKPNLLVDVLDRNSVVYELPRGNEIQNYETALNLLPSLANTYHDIRDDIQRTRSLNIVKKAGDWFFIKSGNNKYIATCLSFSVTMTEDEFNTCIVINNNTVLIDEGEYYFMYHGVKNKEYTTEKARLTQNNILEEYNLGSGTIEVCNDDNKIEYIEYYKKSEIAVIQKNDELYNTILDSYRRRPLYTTNIPTIVGALGSIIFYIDNNRINYI